MKKRVFAIVAGSLLTFSGFAQQEIPCGTDEALENLHNQFPQLKEEYPILINYSLQIQTVVDENGVEKKKATYVIPVVFHILHEYGSENIPDSRVYTIMEELNEDYSATNADRWFQISLVLSVMLILSSVWRHLTRLETVQTVSSTFTITKQIMVSLFPKSISGTVLVT